MLEVVSLGCWGVLGPWAVLIFVLAFEVEMFPRYPCVQEIFGSCFVDLFCCLFLELWEESCFLLALLWVFLLIFLWILVDYWDVL